MILVPELFHSAPATIAPAVLPPGLALASAAARSARTPGDQPQAAILLIDIDMKGLDA